MTIFSKKQNYKTYFFDSQYHFQLKIIFCQEKIINKDLIIFVG
jgi:hypothetical protein